MNRRHFALFGLAILLGCGPDYPMRGDVPDLVGQTGDLRFNLQFTNEANVDLDLYVREPSGEEIYWQHQQSATGGELDVDCFCGSCPQGPNENTYWPPDSAPHGTYTYWVQFFGSCEGAAAPSSQYTLRVLRGDRIVRTHRGTLSAADPQTEQWTYRFP